MKSGITLLLALVALALVWSEGTAQEAAPEATPPPPTAEVTQLRRPAVEFLEFGDVVGVAQALLDQLEMKEGDALRIVTPNGVEYAAPTKVWGTNPQWLFAKQTIRETLGVEDGAVLLQVQKVVWPTGQPADREIELTTVSRPPTAFLDYGDAVGVGYSVFRVLNCAPGARARISGPGGSRVVTLQLLDRGAHTISMKLTLRNAIGVEDAEGQSVKLRVIAPAPPPQAQDN